MTGTGSFNKPVVLNVSLFMFSRVLLIIGRVDGLLDFELHIFILLVYRSLIQLANFDKQTLNLPSVEVFRAVLLVVFIGKIQCARINQFENIGIDEGGHFVLERKYAGIDIAEHIELALVQVFRRIHDCLGYLLQTMSISISYL